MWVYGFPHRVTGHTTVRPLTLYANDGNGSFSATATLVLVIKPVGKTASIRDFVENNFADTSCDNGESRIFIVAAGPLPADTVLAVIDSKLDTIHADLDLPAAAVVRKTNQFAYRPIERRPSLDDALSAYASVHVHFPYFFSARYNYVNASAVEAAIDTNDDCLRIVSLKERHKFSPTHIKLNADGTVDVFTFFPLKDAPVCYRLGDEWTVVNAKCATLEVAGAGVFWLVTLDTFVGGGGGVRRPEKRKKSAVEPLACEGDPICVYDVPAAAAPTFAHPQCNAFNTFNDRRGAPAATSFSVFDMNRATQRQLDSIQNAFAEYAFAKTEFNRHFAMGVDDRLVMFIGVCAEEDLGIFASAFDRML